MLTNSIMSLILHADTQAEALVVRKPRHNLMHATLFDLLELEFLPGDDETIEVGCASQHPEYENQLRRKVVFRRTEDKVYWRDFPKATLLISEELANGLQLQERSISVVQKLLQPSHIYDRDEAHCAMAQFIDDTVRQMTWHSLSASYLNEMGLYTDGTLRFGCGYRCFLFFPKLALAATCGTSEKSVRRLYLPESARLYDPADHNMRVLFATWAEQANGKVNRFSRWQEMMEQLLPWHSAFWDENGFMACIIREGIQSIFIPKEFYFPTAGPIHFDDAGPYGTFSPKKIASVFK